jgi:hypothetical protein
MDQSSFDRIARLLGGAATRRSGLTAALGGMLGLASLDAAAKSDSHGGRGKRSDRSDKNHKRDKGNGHQKGKPGAEGPCGDGSRTDNACTKDSQCCTGICRKGLKNKDGKGRCRCVRKGKACTEDRNCCKGTCADGVCGGGGRAPIPTGQPCVAGLDTCADSNASCTTYDANDPAGTYCVLPDGQPCNDSDDECQSQKCISGTCLTPVPTSDACTQSDVCASPAATCRTYLEKERNGTFTADTFCLLPNGETCSDDIDCESGNCDSGTCAPQVCDVCTTGCASSDLDQTLKDAPDGAIIRVDAGTWTTTNGESSTVGGGRIQDGRNLTVRACNGVSGVNVTSTASWSVFYIENGDQGGSWTLEGLDIYGASGKNGPWIYISGTSSVLDAALTMRNCTVDNRNSATGLDSFVEIYSYATMTATDTTFTKGAGSSGPEYYGILVYGDTQPSVIDLTRVTVQDSGATNSTSSGGLYLTMANVTLTDCTISNNTGKSYRAGGGITVHASGGPVNLTLAGTTTVTGNTATNNTGVGGINVQTSTTVNHTVTIESTASVTGNTGLAAGGIGHRYQSNETHGTLTVTGGDRVTGNTATSTYQCANIPQNSSAVDVPGCTGF